MSQLLNSLAVGSKTGTEAAEILEATLATKGFGMVLDRTIQLAKTNNPNGAVDPLPR